MTAAFKSADLWGARVGWFQETEREGLVVGAGGGGAHRIFGCSVELYKLSSFPRPLNPNAEPYKL